MNLTCGRARALLIALAVLSLAGCVSVKAPERISFNEPPPRVDSNRIPDTRDHAHARQLLADAYARNQYLEREVADLREDVDELEREHDACAKRYERLQEKCED